MHNYNFGLRRVRRALRYEFCACANHSVARAVRWTYQAAEQGHHTARSRVLSLLAMS